MKPTLPAIFGIVYMDNYQLPRTFFCLKLFKEISFLSRPGGSSHISGAKDEIRSVPK